MAASPNIPSNPVGEIFPQRDDRVVSIRSYVPRDKADVHRLYHEGLITGVVDPLDPAHDLDEVERAYLVRPEDHFWIADVSGEAIGSIAIKLEDNRVAHVRRLRVDGNWKTWRNGAIPRALIAKATQHAREFGGLKLVLHTPVDDREVIALLHQLGFVYAGAKEVPGRHLLEFYLDLYYRPVCSPCAGGGGV